MTHVRVLKGSSCTLVSLCEQMNTTRINVHLSTAMIENVSLLMRFDFGPESEKYAEMRRNQRGISALRAFHHKISLQDI